MSGFRDLLSGVEALAIGCVYPFHFYIDRHEKRLLVFMAQRRLTAAVVYKPLGCGGELTASDSLSALGTQSLGRR